MRLRPCRETRQSRCLAMVTKAVSVLEPGKTSGPITPPSQKLVLPVANTVPGPCQCQQIPKGATSPQYEPSFLPSASPFARGTAPPPPSATHSTKNPNHPQIHYLSLKTFNHHNAALGMVPVCTPGSSAPPPAAPKSG